MNSSEFGKIQVLSNIFSKVQSAKFSVNMEFSLFLGMLPSKKFLVYYVSRS